MKLKFDMILKCFQDYSDSIAGGRHSSVSEESQKVAQMGALALENQFVKKRLQIEENLMLRGLYYKNTG